MISNHFRRYANAVHAETGRSIQEIMHDFVECVRTGKAKYENGKAPCPLCGSFRNVVTSTRKGDAETIRFHKCDLCGNAFQSKESRPEEKTKAPEADLTKPVLNTDNQRKAIAPKRKGRHIKSRGG